MIVTITYFLENEPKEKEEANKTAEEFVYF